MPDGARQVEPRRLQGGPLQILSRIRVRDSIIFQAPTIVGLTLFIPDGSPANIVRAIMLAVGSFLIMAHIFAFNDWADMELDHRNALKRNSSLVERGIASRQMLLLASTLAVLGLAAVASVSPTLAPIALAMVLLGVAYSFPAQGLKAKGIPVLSSALHFTGTVLTFLLGSAAFSPVDVRAVLLGCYFGILITAGHLVQEVQDYADDRLGGVRTNAVQFGQAPMFVLSFALFGFSFVFLIGMAQAGLVPSVAAYTAVLFPVYAAWALRAYRAGLKSASVQQLRNQYRILFAMVVLVLLIGALISDVL